MKDRLSLHLQSCSPLWHQMAVSTLTKHCNACDGNFVVFSKDVTLRKNHQIDPCGPTEDGETGRLGTDQTLVPIVNHNLDSWLSINITANPAYLNGDGRLGSPLLSFWDWVHNMRLSISFTPSHRQNIMVKFNCWQHAWRGIAMPQFTSKGL